MMKAYAWLVLSISLLGWMTEAWAAAAEGALDGLGPSRGMMLFWAALVLLATLPFLGKNLRTLAFLGAVPLLARGIMRLVSELDAARVITSAPPGLLIGLQLAALLLAAQAGAWLAGKAMQRAAAVGKRKRLF